MPHQVHSTGEGGGRGGGGGGGLKEGGGRGRKKREGKVRVLNRRLVCSPVSAIANDLDHLKIILLGANLLEIEPELITSTKQSPELITSTKQSPGLITSTKQSSDLITSTNHYCWS